jgi:RHS repeat-associated protein
VHAFAYSPIDLTASYTAPTLMGGSTTTVYSYNVDGQPTQATRPDSTQVNVSYDPAGRQNAITSPSGAHGYDFDPAGRLAGTTSPGGLGMGYAYDGSLRTGTTYSGPFGGSVNRTYDPKFRLASIDVNGSNPVTFSYDADDLVTSAGPLSLTWHAQHGLLTATALGVVSDAWTYNGFAEPSAYSAVANGTPQFGVTYTRDSLGRITSLSETVGGVTDVYTYAYEPAGWLSTVHKNGGAVGAYTYDANGNRLSFTGPGGTIAGTYDAQDRLTLYGAATFAYSAAGELQSKTVGGQSTTYDYDALGNLLGVSLPGGPSITYVVDGQRRRVARKVNGTLVQAFIYQGQYRVVAELNGSGTVVSRFVYATRFNVPEYMIKAGVTYRIVTDHLGSPRLVINSTTGAVTQRMDYDEFGNVLSDTNPGFQPFGFAGGLYDPDTKLVRFGARDYDPATGRWTAKDPIGFWGADSNLYAYASGNPVNETDSYGLLDPNGFMVFGIGYTAADYQAGKASVSKGLQQKKKGMTPSEADAVAEQIMQEMQNGEAKNIKNLKEAIEKGKDAKEIEKNKAEIEKILEEIYKRCKEKGRIK